MCVHECVSACECECIRVCVCVCWLLLFPLTEIKVVDDGLRLPNVYSYQEQCLAEAIPASEQGSYNRMGK